MGVICKVCKIESEDLLVCRQCEGDFCDDCGAEYNQFTQVDYDCCKECVENKKYGIN